MAYAYTIDAAVPADTDLVSEGAEAIRDFKNAVLERILTIISTGGINTDPWVITPRSNLTPGTNNTYDLGVTGTRWRHGWLSGTLAVAGLVTLAAGLTISAGTLTAQALTTTTIAASGLITANAGLTVTAGTSALQAITGTSLTVSGTSALGVVTATSGQFGTGTAGISGLLAIVNSGGEAGLSTTVYRNAGGQVAHYNFFARGTSGAPAALQNNDVMLQHYSRGYDGAGFRDAGMIEIAADAAPTSGSKMPGRFRVYVAKASDGSLTQAFQIDSALSVTIASLAGSGTRNVVVDANGVMSAP